MLVLGLLFLFGAFAIASGDRSLFGALAILPVMTIATALTRAYEARQPGKSDAWVTAVVFCGVFFALTSLHPLAQDIPAVIVAIVFAGIAVQRASWLYRRDHKGAAIFVTSMTLFLAGWSVAFAGYKPWRYDETALLGVKQFTSYELSFREKAGHFDALTGDQIAKRWNQEFLTLRHRDDPGPIVTAAIHARYSPGRDHFVLRVKPNGAVPFLPYSFFTSWNVYRADDSGSIRRERVHSDRWCSDDAPLIARVGDLHWYLAHESVDSESALALLRTIEGDDAIRETLRSGNPTGRAAAVRAAAESKASDSTAILVAAVHDADAAVRLAAVTSLRFRRDPASVPTLVEAVNDRDEQVMFAAADALREIRDPRTFDLMAPMLASSNAPEKVRYQAALTLGTAGGERAVPLLVAEFNRSPVLPSLQKGILVGLGYTKSEAAVPSLLAATHFDDAAGLRETAAYALGQIGSPEAKARLRQMAASDPSMSVRDTAKRFLQ